MGNCNLAPNDLLCEHGFHPFPDLGRLASLDVLRAGSGGITTNTTTPMELYRHRLRAEVWVGADRADRKDRSGHSRFGSAAPGTVIGHRELWLGFTKFHLSSEHDSHTAVTRGERLLEYVQTSRNASTGRISSGLNGTARAALRSYRSGGTLPRASTEPAADTLSYASTF